MARPESSKPVPRAAATFPVGSRQENRLETASAGRRLSWLAAIIIGLIVVGLIAAAIAIFGAHHSASTVVS